MGGRDALTMPDSFRGQRRRCKLFTRRDLKIAAIMIAALLLALSLQQESAPQFADEVTVTATRTRARVAETASSVVVLNSEDLETTAAPAIDDALRQVPGFTLFRRSGSRTANPTSQGASLRAIGASGASRVLVLDDGIPLNDPFGGWVYWGRVPRAALQQIEVVRGGASELYGSGALGGVIQLIRREPAGGLKVEVSAGTEETWDASLFASSQVADWFVAFAGELFRTDGYIPVRETEQGPVDQPLNSRRGTADMTLTRIQDDSRLFVRGSVFKEARANGTPLQSNDTSTRQVSAGLDTRLGSSPLTLRAYFADQTYHQSFSAIAEDRQTERLTRLQEVPVDAFGLAGQFMRPVGRAHTLVAGFETRRIEGFSDELILGAGVTRSHSGGTQRVAGAYLEDLIQASPRLSLTAAARFDSWSNEDRHDSELSPRLAGRYALTDSLALAGSIYQSFRAPTLNELYRDFRVGNVLTLANENLGAERLSGAEAGLIGSHRRLSARGTVFVMDVERNIANVTTSVQPGLTIRQRQNLGETRSRGIEIDAQTWVGRSIRLSAGYLFADATVRQFSANPELEGLEVAQIPRHQGSAQAQFVLPRHTTAGIQLRWASHQFEDDLNQIELDRFTVVDALFSMPMGARSALILAVENVFDEEYAIGATPILTLGSPRFIRLGLRWSDGSGADH